MRSPTISKTTRVLVAVLALAVVATLAELAAPGVVMASEGAQAAGDRGLSAAAIVGLVFSFLLAGLLLMIALPFILPKPPGR